MINPQWENTLVKYFTSVKELDDEVISLFIHYRLKTSEVNYVRMLILFLRPCSNNWI